MTRGFLILRIFLESRRYKLTHKNQNYRNAWSGNATPNTSLISRPRPPNAFQTLDTDEVFPVYRKACGLRNCDYEAAAATPIVAQFRVERHRRDTH